MSTVPSVFILSLILSISVAELVMEPLPGHQRDEDVILQYEVVR